MGSRVLALAGALVLATTGLPARADTPPSVWDRARGPEVSAHWALHVRIQRLLRAPSDDETGPRLEWKRDAELHCEAALAMLDDAGAASSPDVRLRFDLGMVLFELADLSGRMDLYDKAARTLSAALALGPDAEGSTEALAQLVYAYARLDRPREELETWHRYIPRIVDPRTRAVDLMNMGEAEMRLGRIDDALGTLRQVLRESAELPNTSSTYVLTLWDMAVALDRSGDARGALEYATKAAAETAIDSHGYPITGRGLIAHDDSVFFVPGWERYWYLALGSEALGRQDADPREALAYFIESEHEWDQFLLQATAAGVSESASVGPRRNDDAGKGAAVAWLRIAHLRRDRVHAERLAAEKRVPRSGARPARERE